MARYIDADALIDFLDVGHLRHPSDLCFSEVDVANLLLHAPTISPDEVRGVGEWMPAETELGCACSACGINLDEYVHGGEWVSLTKKPSYCPSCGARMKVSEDTRKN